MSNRSPIISEEEMMKRRRKSIEAVKEEENTGDAVSYPGCVKVEYESNGRLNQPKVLYFRDYSMEEVNNLVVTKDDELLDTLVKCLNAMKQNEPDFRIEDMSQENLLDTLIAIKIQFDNRYHTHNWICQCQMAEDPSSQVINEDQLDLLELKYRNIEESDKVLQKIIGERLKELTEDQYKQYLLHKYKDNPLPDIDAHTVDKEIESIKISDKMILEHDGNMYEFRTYQTVRDVLKAKKYALDKYDPKIKYVQNRREANVPLDEVKAKKEREIENLKVERAQTLMLYAKAMMLEKKNGNRLTDIEKLEIIKQLPRFVTKDFYDLVEKIEYGVYDKRELPCPLCGNNSERSLQHEINSLRLLPERDSKSNDTVRANAGSKQSSGFNIYFGV